MALGRDIRAGVFDRVQSFSAREVGPVRRALADHPHHQRRPAGPDAGADDVHPDGLGADHVRRRHRSWRSARTCRCRRCCWSWCRCWASRSSLIIRRMRPLFRTMQERIDTVNRVLREQITGIRVIRAFVRDELRAASASAGPTTSSPTCRWRTGRLMALMFPVVMAIVNISSVGRAVVRRPPDRQRRHADRRADRVPQLPDADPDVGDDGHLHVHDGAARRGVRRAHRGGAGHRRPASYRRRRRSPRCAGTASWSCATSSFAYPGAEDRGAARRRPGRPARRDDRGDRLHRQRQVHPARA